MRFQTRHSEDADYTPAGNWNEGILILCDSAADMRDNLYKGCEAYTGKKVKAQSERYMSGTDSWVDKMSPAQAFEAGVVGHDKYLKEVMHVMSEIESQLGETTGKTWRRRPVGMFPSVPDAIMGRPDSMWRKEDETSDRAPVTVWVNPTSSAGWSAEHLSKRGAAICAFLLKLAQFRPVRLNVCSIYDGERGNVGIIVPIDTAPMNVSQIAHILCSPAWHRQTYWAGHGCFGSPLIWEHTFSHYGNDPTNLNYIRDTKNFVGADERDLFIPPAFLHDDMVKRPVEWVKRTLANYLNETEEA